MKMADIEVQTVEEFQRRTDITDRIWAHYAHAREKHPYFCDSLLPDYLLRDNIRERIARNLSFARRRIKVGVHDHNLMWNGIADCEVWEATEAMFNGDNAAAVEKLYDAIAVLLRTIDVLEGRQELGKPKGGAK